MEDNKQFFDESSFIEKKEELSSQSVDSEILDLSYHIRRKENLFYLTVEKKEERCNGSELRSLLSLGKEKNLLQEADKLLLSHLSLKLAPSQTIHQFSAHELEVLLYYLKDCSFPVFYNDEQLFFSVDEYKLDLVLEFETDDTISLIVRSGGEFFFSTEKAFFLSDNVLYFLSMHIPLAFYKELCSGTNRFTIESFFVFKEQLLERLRCAHKIQISEELEELSSLRIETKIAPVVVEVGKNSHFISLELKYKVGQKFYPLDNYTYLETQSWHDKKSLITISRENSKLIQYHSDETLSEYTFSDFLEESKIRYTPSQKSPFLIMIPINALERVLTTLLPKLEQYFPIEYKDGIELNLNKVKVSFELDTYFSKHLNLFEFSVQFKIGESNISLERLKEILTSSKRYFELEGKTYSLDNIRDINKWIEFLMNYEFKANENKYKAPSQAALELHDFAKKFDETVSIRQNTEYKELLQEVEGKRPLVDIALPLEVDSLLRDYQKEGVYWIHFLQKYGFGGILADEMGLGKTLQALTVLAMNKGGQHLVICPKSLMFNWENESKRYFPNLKVLVVTGESEKRKRLLDEVSRYDIIITSYSILQKDYQYYIEKNLKFEFLVLDEAHYVKNQGTLSAKAVRLVEAKRKILLTGTPLENNLEELYGTFDLVMPGYLKSQGEFRNEFIAKIERNNLIALEILQSKIRPFILRRTKKQVLQELPEKQEQIVLNEMTNKQALIYNEVLSRVKQETYDLIREQGFEKSRIKILSALLKLRQICNHPAQIDKSFDHEEDISGKYQQFKDLLEEVLEGGDKVLVFSQFTAMLDIFQRDLEKDGVSFLRLDGSSKNRQELVDRFNEDERVRVFLISLKAGGVGLNLTSANTVFLYDPWWNPMVEQQAMDRAHRIGQKKTVNIYKFITKNSVEEKILKLQERKGTLFENLINEDNGFIRKLEWEDLMELFE
ncbi:MAG: DEAD/DEAH box helicase [Candidatus Woesearchaeota archaeon]|nr:MAG: DEAD/DEAH box helicase [Candidatus Woesearchaeota archaeon]